MQATRTGNLHVMRRRQQSNCRPACCRAMETTLRHRTYSPSHAETREITAADETTSFFSVEALLLTGMKLTPHLARCARCSETASQFSDRVCEGYFHFSTTTSYGNESVGYGLLWPASALVLCKEPLCGVHSGGWNHLSSNGVAGRRSCSK
ncbi:hypothetical protein N657DRAFT_388084 [Parathielavia appendiculata]|uniref:Uncharacterized protein n=1 Tax=Parathielavia appendiculata TaxID=2587402 RepID=A0AAN6Z460_9PEZI|nr:hypothetical protein N657DRAFT_388084 [Parathielavia appendiculata]